MDVDRAAMLAADLHVPLHAEDGPHKAGEWLH